MESVFIMFKYRSDTAPMKVSLCIRFEDLLVSVCKEWNELSVATLVLRYSVPGFERCLLRSQTNLTCMFDVMKSFSMKCVEVEVSTMAIVCDSRSDMVGTSERIFALEYEQESSATESSTTKVLLSDHWARLIREVGQQFSGGVDEFRKALDKYSVKSGFHFHLNRNNKKRVHAFCYQKGSVKLCTWSITATLQKSTGAFVIRKFNNEHTCNLEIVSERSKRLSSRRIGELIEDDVRNKPTYAAIDVITLMQGSYGISITYKKAWKAVSYANSLIFGDADKSFQELQWYVPAALSQNPGSRIVLEVDNASNRFKRLFVAFGACIHGFQYIRPMLFIDGAHLFGKFKGTLLSATGKNGNRGLYPLAFAIVDGETQDNWVWFLEQLRCIVGEERKMTFISDRNAGILDAVPRVFPGADHYFCIYHLKENLKSKFNGPASGFKRDRMLELFGNCAYANTVPLFNNYMKTMLDEGGIIMQRFLDSLPPKNWAKAFSIGCRYGEMASSAIESFNSWVLPYRGLPIVRLIEGIRKGLMKWHVDRKQESDRWETVLCKGVAKTVYDLMDKNRSWNRLRASEYIFEVLTDPSYTVNVAERSCSCGGWQVEGFPCEHALVCFPRSNLLVHDYIELYFHSSMYRKAYELPIYPVPTSLKSEFEVHGLPSILPPLSRRQSGRPKKLRFRSRVEKEKTRKIKCGRCGQQGYHNSRTCKQPLVDGRIVLRD